MKKKLWIVISAAAVACSAWLGITVARQKDKQEPVAFLANGLPANPMAYWISGFATNADGSTNYGRIVVIDTRTGKPVGE
jgi:hypothetical protein